jgi:hypothetical protein
VICCQVFSIFFFALRTGQNRVVSGRNWLPLICPFFDTIGDFSPSRSWKAKSAKSLLAEAFSNGIAALAYLPGQCFGDRVFDSGVVQFREDHFGQFPHTAARKRIGCPLSSSAVR